MTTTNFSAHQAHHIERHLAAILNSPAAARIFDADELAALHFLAQRAAEARTAAV